ncbi:DUF4199 domain-containing protein [Marinoscillum furvescens]|uniref:Uncharacterized protein DUF4199 n=1 Tax=Marinoscillum furvescens DSM 4134 TaxID=1122208 RepID=A0A3D9KWH4_MARFU|nr:DUF4199 domain-containing protein [Marinoscillum furvescens]RED92454.1 uncharacterized protein DUF4199 [Marinoscillum furvescens DSM 4134]
MKTIESRGLRYGLSITVALVAFFFIMKAFGLIHNYGLRAFNGIIMFVGVYLAIYRYKQQKQEQFEFLQGLGVGLITTLVVALSFSAFVTFFMMANPDFTAAVKANEPHGIYINEWGVALGIFIEAAASGFIFSFMTMQQLKTNILPEIKKNKKHLAIDGKH